MFSKSNDHPDVDIKSDISKNPLESILQEINNSPNAAHFKKLLLDSTKKVLVSELARGIVHEINNPLQIIIGKIQTAMVDDNNRDILRVIEKQTFQISSLLKIISDTSKEGKTDSVDVIEVNSFIRNTVELVRSQIEKRGIQVQFHFENDSSFVQCNSIYLKQLILNLVFDAKKRMTNGGQLCISSHRNGPDTIQIEFNDNTYEIEDAFGGNALEYDKEISSSNKLDLNEIGRLLLVNEIGGEIDCERSESSGNKVIIKLPQKIY